MPRPRVATSARKSHLRNQEDQKVTYAIRGRAVDVVNDNEEEEEASK